MRILLLVAPFALALIGLVFLQTGTFSTDRVPQSENTPAPLLELTRVTNVAARLPTDASTPPQPAPAVADTEALSDIQLMTSSVLEGLGVQTRAAPQPGGQSDEMRNLTSAVLSGLASSGAVTGQARTTTEDQPLAALISRAVNQGQSDAYIGALINEAAASGQVNVPAGFVQPDGRVDTATLLASVVPSGHGGEASFLMSESALAAITTMRDGVRYYTVAPGDSLAALAVKFYGRAGAYPMLFEANKDILSAPDMIRIGQKLRIPGQG